MQSFQVTCDSSFIEMLQTINKFAPPGYAPPLPGLIRGTLLTAAYEKSKEEAKVMFKDNEHNCALTIMSDGKTNNGKVPICNFIAKSAKGAHFLAAVDMSLKDKSNKKMADYIHEQCVETGVEAAQLASYSLKHLLASYSRCINCFKHKQQATQPNTSALLACQHANVRTCRSPA